MLLQFAINFDSKLTTVALGKSKLKIADIV